jgi:hypothetical protein
MGIFWFDGSQQLFSLHPFTSSKDDLLAAIDGIEADLCVDCSSTNLFGAVVSAIDTAVGRYNYHKAQKIISGAAVVIFTDGDDQAGYKTLAQATTAITSAKTQTSNGVQVFTVGLGSEAELNQLKAIGVDGFNFATDKASLEQTFQETAQMVRDEANSYYIFEYCSPKRSGTVGLKIIAKDNSGKQGTLTYEFDAGKFVGPFNCQ